MPRLIWTPEALADLARLHNFLVSNNPDAARRAIAAIRAGVRLLEDHPRVGRVMADMPEGFRAWPISFGASGYVALYRLHDERVVILAVKHGREQGFTPYDG